MPPKQVFISYSHNSNDRPLLEQLLRQLAPLKQAGLITWWEDSMIPPGGDWDQEISRHLNAADFVLLLVSADYTNSDYVNRIEVPVAMERQQQDACVVIPVLLRNCLYDLMPYARYEFLPKLPENQRLLPVDQWNNLDEALKTVVYRLYTLASGTQGQKAIQTDYGLNIKDDPFRAEMRRKISQLKIDEVMGRIHLVNCNRTDLRDAFEAGFDARTAADCREHYYFLSACRTQMPPSLGERMIYELLGGLMDEHQEAVHIRTNPKNNERVKIESLPLGYSLEKSQTLFRDFCARWFGWPDHLEFEQAIRQNILPGPRFRYAVLVLEFSKKEWKPFMTEYLAWIRQSFAARAPGGPVLLVFLVGYHPNLHDSRDEKSSQILNAIDQYCADKTDSGHFYPLEAVDLSDLFDWFGDLGVHNNARIQPLLETLIADMTEAERIQYLNRELLNMDRIELIQEMVFDLYNQ